VEGAVMNKPRGSLADFFKPRKVALVGVTYKSEGSGIIDSRFECYGHVGKLFAVNKNGTVAHGMDGYKSCTEIADKVDMAYIFVPPTAVAGAIADAAKAGIRNAVILTSGFAEIGAKGVALQNEVLAAANENGVRILGPNSLGFANIAARAVTTSIGTRLPLLVGRLGIVSQSGAVANEIAKFA